MAAPKATHTYDIHQRYHACPNCGKILESRTDYVYKYGKYEKELECERCHHHWTEVKAHIPSFAPLFDARRK